MRKVFSIILAALLSLSTAMTCFAAYGDIGVITPVTGENVIFFHTFDGDGADTGNRGVDALDTDVYKGGTISLNNKVYESNCIVVNGFNNYIELGALEDGWYRISFLHRADWVDQEDPEINSPVGIIMVYEDGSELDLRNYYDYNISYNIREGNKNFLGNDFSKGNMIYCARTNQNALPVSIMFKATEGKKYKVRYGIRTDVSGKQLQMLVDDVKLCKIRGTDAPIIGVPAPDDLYNASFEHTAVAYNNTGYSGDALIISAVYNSKNKCVGIASANVNFDGIIGESRELKVAFPIGDEEDTSGYIARTYVWDNINDGNPIAAMEDAYAGVLNSNSGFEAVSGENSFAGWNLVGDGSIEVSTDSCSGKYSAMIVPNGSSAGITPGMIYNLRNMYGDGTYKLSAKVKAVDGTTSVSLSGKYNNHSFNGATQTISGSSVVANADEWVEVSYELNEAKFNGDFREAENCYILNLTSDKPFLVDDFKLTKLD